MPSQPATICPANREDPAVLTPGILLDMAQAQLPAPKSSGPSPWDEAVALALASGRKPTEIARRLAKGDPEKAKHYRKKLARKTRDPAFKQAVAEASQSTMLLGIPGAVNALVRRAHRGRPDAIKLLFEASGFHNPRVQHEHSGEVNIKLTMPRPAAIGETGIVDAEVVEEESE